MILIFGESLLVIKLHLLMTSFATMPTSFSEVKRKSVVEKIGAVPVSAGACTFATAKSNNSSN